MATSTYRNAPVSRAVVTAATDTAVHGAVNYYDPVAAGVNQAVAAPAPVAGNDGDFFITKNLSANTSFQASLTYLNHLGVSTTIALLPFQSLVLRQVGNAGWTTESDSIGTSQVGTIADGRGFGPVGNDGNNITVNYTTNWGVTAAGVAYHDPAGAAAGDEATFGLDVNGNLVVTGIFH